MQYLLNRVFPGIKTHVNTLSDSPFTGIHHNECCIAILRDNGDYDRFLLLCSILSIQSDAWKEAASIDDLPAILTGVETFRTSLCLGFWLDDHCVCCVDSMDAFAALMDWIQTFYINA